MNLIISKLQTKDWRKKQEWYKNGKSNECEKYQINQIEIITKKKILKTDERIHMETMIIQKNKNPDSFEWTENFDGYMMINNKKFYFNLKFVCDKGGAQTRTLREVYHFIKCQTKLKTENTYFMNILDGNCCFLNIKKFDKLKGNENIFIGDMCEFYDYIKDKIE